MKIFSVLNSRQTVALLTIEGIKVGLFQSTLRKMVWIEPDIGEIEERTFAPLSHATLGERG